MGNWGWLLDESISKQAPMNFVLFDYRSVGGSTGKFTGSKDLLIDGASIVNWVRKEVKTPNDKINLYGLSLGGAVATKTAAADEALTGWVVGERSFSCLENWILAQVSKARKCLNNLPPQNCLKSSMKWMATKALHLESLAITILKHQGLEFDAAADFPKIQGKKLVIYHPEDRVIPYDASMAKQFPQGAYLLNGNDGDNHNTSLEKYFGAKTDIGNFVFS
jgi:pimeloyl-ACP methyl ester carboxylesterase